MQGAPSYVFSGGVVAGADRVQITGRFEAPDQLDETIQVPGRSAVEVVLSPTGSFVRDPSTAPWRRTTGSANTTDPRSAFGVLLQATEVAVSGDTYSFTIPAQAAQRLLAGLTPTAAATGSAVIKGGVLTHLAVTFPSQGQVVSLSLDYASVGSAPPVTVPTIS